MGTLALTELQEKLAALHEATINDLLKRLQSGEATPAEINAAIKLLANNKIQAPEEKESPLGKLADALPNFDNDERRTH